MRSIKLSSGDFVVDMAIVHENSTIITISENGFGKRTPVDEFRLQQRGGSGVKAGIFTEKTGKLVALKQIEEDCDLLLIADNGVIIRTHVDSISQFSRVSQGVKIMKLKNDAKITSVALTEKDTEETTDENILEETTQNENLETANKEDLE